METRNVRDDGVPKISGGHAEPPIARARVPLRRKLSVVSSAHAQSVPWMNPTDLRRRHGKLAVATFFAILTCPPLALWLVIWSVTTIVGHRP